MELGNYYFLFSNCIPVKGYTRAIISDLTREKFDFIPISLYKILEKRKRKRIIDIINAQNEGDKLIVTEYFEFLKQKEYIQLCSKQDLKRFPNLSKKWESPYYISSLIIEFSDKINIIEIIKKVEIFGKL